MKRNEGSVDRVIRIIAGVVIFAVGLYFKSWWGLVGIVPPATGIVGFCALYPLFSISTCSLKHTGDE